MFSKFTFVKYYGELSNYWKIESQIIPKVLRKLNGSVVFLFIYSLCIHCSSYWYKN